MTHGERRGVVGRFERLRRENLSAGPWSPEAAERMLKARGWRLDFEPPEGYFTVQYLPPKGADKDIRPVGIDRSEPIRLNDPVFFFLHKNLKVSKRTLRRELDGH
jgi:hypothetical protein